MDTDKLIKTLINSYFREYGKVKKLYEEYKKGKLNPKKTNEMKEDLQNIKNKVNYLLEQMNEKIKTTSEIKDYNIKIYEQYKNLRDTLTMMNDEIAEIEKAISREQNGEPNTNT